MADLPLAPDLAPAERADAARNRAKILAAAEELIAERGIEHVSMDDVARRACVGKGTVYRRFGDRASLALALLDAQERELQESLLRGEPPLGPGAPARERLHAFGEAYLDLLELHGPLMAEAERAHRHRLPPYGVYRAHMIHLLEGRPDPDVTADHLLAALSSGVFVHHRHDRGFALDRIKAGWRSLADAVLAARRGPSPA